MPSMMMLGVTIKLFDQMTGGLRGIAGQVDGLSGKLKSLGGVGMKSLGAGLVAGAALLKTIDAFSELEDASTRLKVTMMDGNGLTGAFSQVNALAVKLGNELPGTSADFLNMMAALKAQGISDDSILGGVGEAAAKMAVLLKKTPEEMAVFAAKLKQALGVSDADMLKFMDTIQRTYFLGVDATEMMYAFGRSAGALKTIKQQGLEAGKALAPLFAMWIKGGMTGETVGTGFSAISNSLLDAKKLGKGNAVLKSFGMGALNFTDKKGNFLGIEHMVKEFDKLKSLGAVKLNSVLKEIFGGGQDQAMVATLVTEGIEGYRKQVEAMEKQADLSKRVNMQLGTLKNLWDAASGTFTNALAGFGGAMGDDLKALTKWFGDLSEAVAKFMAQNPVLTQWIGRLALGFVTLAIVGGTALIALAGFGTFISLAVPGITALATAFGFLGTVISVVGRAFLLNPIGLVVTGIAVAALLIYKYWEPIKGFFADLWAGIKNSFTSAVDWIGQKLQTLSDLMPEWMKKYTLPGMAIQFAAEKLGPERPSATAPQGDANGKIDGEIRVRVDQDGRVSSVSAASNLPRLPMNVDAGRSMVTP